MTTPQVCIPNIGGPGRRQRAVAGAVTLAITAGLFAAIVLLDVPLLLRAGIFVPAVVGAMGVLQAKEKT